MLVLINALEYKHQIGNWKLLMVVDAFSNLIGVYLVVMWGHTYQRRSRIQEGQVASAGSS